MCQCRNLQGILSYNTLNKVGLLKSSSELPPSPFEYHVPQSNMIVRFDDFRARIPGPDVVQCLLQAANLVNLHFGDTRPIVATTWIQTNSGSVRLKIYPHSRGVFTWGMCGTAIRGITDFVTTYGYIDMDFYILENGFTVGGGLVTVL